VDENRQWFKASKGLEVCENLKRCEFCAHAILHPESLMEVSDAA
jgi:hypothetical protein